MSPCLRRRPAVAPTNAAIDQAIEILTGMPAGISELPWSNATVNGRVARRLKEYAALMLG